MAAKMKDRNVPFYYHETLEGGVWCRFYQCTGGRTLGLYFWLFQYAANGVKWDKEKREVVRKA
ncbi:hypothetical protein DDZ16_16605 [Marinilabilia rubra]|uniref:Uncharacterized protein n=1 Tax=Marinilabilia rubra TaxID=2162893 RepID=A0A2U2B5D8_9BACT|nr:hypothetical protein DDZ16_16605 [Marinilabilia rubra]